MEKKKENIRLNGKEDLKGSLKLMDHNKKNLQKQRKRPDKFFLPKKNPNNLIKKNLK